MVSRVESNNFMSIFKTSLYNSNPSNMISTRKKFKKKQKKCTRVLNVDRIPLNLITAHCLVSQNIYDLVKR